MQNDGNFYWTSIQSSRGLVRVFLKKTEVENKWAIVVFSEAAFH